MAAKERRQSLRSVEYFSNRPSVRTAAGRSSASESVCTDQMVVTDLGIMKFDEETKRMYLAYYYPFSSPEMVQENTGFEVDVSRAQLFEGPVPLQVNST